MGLDGLLRARSAVALRHPERHRRERVEPGDRPAPRRALSPRQRSSAAAQNKRALQRALRPRAGGERAALRRDQPALRAEGARPPARGAAASSCAEARSSSCSAPATQTLEQGFRAAAAAAPGRVGVIIGYDEALAHLIQGGADALLVPSRFEPCGLTQLCALRYGAVPVVARVGGLNDTVIDANEMALAAGVATGFQFAPVTREALEHAIGRAAALWKRPEVWRRLQATRWRFRLAGKTRPHAMRSSTAKSAPSALDRMESR